MNQECYYRATVYLESMNRSTLVTSLTAALLACSPADQPTAPTHEPHVLRANINGVQFAAREELVARYVRGVVSIAARDADGRTVHITFLSDLHSGAVDIGENSQNSGITGMERAYWRTNLAGGRGKVDVQEIDHSHIKGTFEFHAVAVPQTTASGRRAATGSFNVQFTPDSMYAWSSVIR